MVLNMYAYTTGISTIATVFIDWQQPFRKVLVISGYIRCVETFQHDQSEFCILSLAVLHLNVMSADTLCICCVVQIIFPFSQLPPFLSLLFLHLPLASSHSAAEADNKPRSHRAVYSPSGFRRRSGRRRTTRRRGG